jgi:hypothetical protein
LSEKTIRVCDGCQAEEEDLERVKAEWGTWFRPKNRIGGGSRLDFCGICAGGTEDAILKYASVMATRNGHHPRPPSEEDTDTETPVVDQILDRRQRSGQMPRDGPILTKDDRARLAAYKAAAESPDPRQPPSPARAPVEAGPSRKY